MMWPVKRPTLTAVEAFEVCIPGIRNKTDRKRYEDVKAFIEHAETMFYGAATAAELHLIEKAANIDGKVTATEMTALYDRHMARENSRGRAIYDDLMLAADDDLCPFCGHRQVSTLDHCMPKADHPALAVTPINMVPCCKDCNWSKGNMPLVKAEDQFLNAYFDDVTNETWLKAEMVHGTPAGIKYSVHGPLGWAPVLLARVENQFAKLDLASLYASQGSRHLRNMSGALRRIHHASGPEAVRADLLPSHESCQEVDRNSWMCALYLAAADSDWYCDGGYVGAQVPTF